MLTPSVGGLGEERKANIKLAWFFALVALLFVLANRLGRVTDGRETSFGPDSPALHPVFYPLRAATNVPIGQLVGRTSSSSEWMSLSGTSKQRVPAVRESMDSNLTWIEMPPGGWVDGEFYDAGESPGEHAYVIYVKPARDANGSRIISQSYTSSAN